MEDTVYFVHISDTHFGPTREYGRFGHISYPCAVKLVAEINNLPVTPDFVIHTGDVATDPTPEAYALAAEVFQALRVPIYYVVGNHDTARDIRRCLTLGPHEPLSDDPDVLSYAFEVKGYRFIVLDARGPDEIDPHGIFSPQQLAIARQEAAPHGPPLTIFMHYPVMPMNSPWMDANMLVLNGMELHQALLPARDRLRGVFYGHVHQSMQTMRDGITYTAVPSAFSQFSAWPTDVETGFDTDYPPGYNFVQLSPEQTIVHQQLFVRP